MRRNCFFFCLLLLFAIPIFADVITPLSYYTLPLLIPIILLEAVLLFLLFRKWFVGVKWWKAALISVFANLASSAVGLAIPLYKNRTENMMWIGLAFVLSVFIEWVLYMPFIRQKYWALFGISAIANLASYILIIALAL
jgi:hypothetical protein